MISEMLQPCLLHVDWMYAQILVTIADLSGHKSLKTTTFRSK